jgi:hypothetical protein
MLKMPPTTVLRRAPATFPVQQFSMPEANSPQRVFATPSPASVSAAPASVVDALFDRAMQQLAMPGLTLHTLPQPGAAKQRDTAADAVQSTSSPQRMNAEHTSPQPVPLSHSEVTHIADQVARVLERQARFERERRGSF